MNEDNTIEEVSTDKEITTEQVINNAPNPTGKGGFGENPENINEGGRPKNSMKSYIARVLAGKSDKEKAKWLKKHKISGEFQWKMGEGNPHNTSDEKHEVNITGCEIRTFK